MDLEYSIIKLQVTLLPYSVFAKTGTEDEKKKYYNNYSDLFSRQRARKQARIAICSVSAQQRQNKRVISMLIK
jgi:hypothetical protein